MSVWNLRNRRWIPVLISAVVFMASLTQTAFVVDWSFSLDYVDPQKVPSTLPLLFGWGGLLCGSNLLVWPSLVASWVFACKKWLIATVIAWLCIIGLVSITLIFPAFHDAGLGYAAWLANPGIVATWVLYLCDKKPAAQISAAISLGLTLSFLTVPEVHFLGPRQLNPVPIVSYGIGYWLWVASAAILTVGICADMYRSSVRAKAGRWQAVR